MIIDLISRTKAAVRELDNLNYRKMKKILMVDSRDNDLIHSHAHDVDNDIPVSGVLCIDLRLFFTNDWCVCVNRKTNWWPIIVKAIPSRVLTVAKAEALAPAVKVVAQVVCPRIPRATLLTNVRFL